MSVTLPITILVEGVVIYVFSRWRNKPLRSLLLTMVLANLVTQPILWVVLNLFFRQYLVSLLIAEIFVWVIESLMFYGIRSNHLNLQEAAFLSLGMNFASLAFGWFLPV